MQWLNAMLKWEEKTALYEKQKANERKRFSQSKSLKRSKGFEKETEEFQKYSTIRHFRTKTQGDPYENLLPCAHQHIFP